MGFSFFQLNTNGLRLAYDTAYVRRLKAAGLGCVFLQFDGTNDAIYQTIRGAALLAAKTKAISNCADQRLGVVLVPTLVPGVNTGDIGGIIDYALARMPAVRGVHFQPISYFGRYPKPPRDCDRITIPEVMHQIEQQTGGRIRAAEFRPPAAENAHCSFHGNFVVTSDGTLKPAANVSDSGCCGPAAQRGQAAGATGLLRIRSRRGSRQEGATVCSSPLDPPRQRRWQADAAECRGYHETGQPGCVSRTVPQQSFCVSGMAFQDAWNIDLERLRDCFIHVVGADERIVPFCAYNLTDVLGNSLYRRK